MLDHERALIEATTRFCLTPVDGEDQAAFPRAYEALLMEHERYLAAVAVEVTVNDAGAWRHDAPETSRRAAITIPDRGSLRGQMLGLFCNLSYAGWTDFELTDHFARDPRTIGSCRRDLVKAGLIQELGDYRYKESDVEQKRPCTIWVITDHGLAVWRKLNDGGRG